MNSYRDRLQDPAFVAERKALWKDNVGPALRKIFRTTQRDWGITGKDVIAACKEVFLTGETEAIRARGGLLWGHLSYIWVFRLVPFHCEDYWTEFFSTTLYEWVPQAKLEGAPRDFCGIRQDHRQVGWPVAWDASLHRFFYGAEYREKLSVLGQRIAHPESLMEVHCQWTAHLLKTLCGMLPAENKWTATYDYWLSTLPLSDADCFDLCDYESYNPKSGLMNRLLWILSSWHEAIDIERQRAKGLPGVSIPSYEELTADPALVALVDRLRRDLEPGVRRPEFSHLWQQIRDPAYHYYPVPKAKRSKAATPRRSITGAARRNPYLEDGKAVIDTAPFTSFERSDVGAHFRNAWRAVLGLAAGEIGECKVTTRTEGEETFTCKVRIVTLGNTYRFKYLVDRSEADRAFYDHLAELAESEELSGRFQVDPYELDDAVVVVYGPASDGGGAASG